MSVAYYKRKDGSEVRREKLFFSILPTRDSK